MSKISTLVSLLLLLLSNSFVFADSVSIKEAFEKGKTSGDVTVYHESKESKKSTSDSGITSGSIGLNYETDQINGFSAAFGFRANHEFYEKTKGVDYDVSYANSAIMNIAALKYANENFAISLGRQEIDLEWLGDFNEAIVTEIKAIQDTSIVMAYSKRKAEIEIDVTENFKNINGNNGLYILDIKNTSLANVEINPYFYSAPNLADFYGIKSSYDNDLFGATAHYAKSSEDTQKDGNIYNLEARLNIAPISLAVGYIGTDKDTGAGNISTFGDNISPLDDGEQVYSADAQTVYAGATYLISDLALTALYGKTQFSSKNLEAKELNLIAEYPISTNINTALTYVNYDEDKSDSNYEKLFANVTYSF
jgi:hypothetical protein